MDPAVLVWEEWEQDFAVYDRRTGETHILNLLPVEVLSILGQEPMSTTGVSRELARRCDVELSREWENRVREILGKLQALSLVESVPE